MAIKVRDFEVRLTHNKEERRMVRALRYDVFVEEEGATPTAEQKELHEEFDEFDKYAEYMAVFHNGKIVGTYRIIDKKAADKMGGFYTETEFNISKIRWLCVCCGRDLVNMSCAGASRFCLALHLGLGKSLLNRPRRYRICITIIFRHCVCARA